jgi:hypothetical protein
MSGVSQKKFGVTDLTGAWSLVCVGRGDRTISEQRRFTMFGEIIQKKGGIAEGVDATLQI